jgi:hypothetical protein
MFLMISQGQDRVNKAAIRELLLGKFGKDRAEAEKYIKEAGLVGEGEVTY